MLGESDVRLAAELGALAADGDATRAIRVLARHTGAVMAQLDAWDGRAASTVGVLDCPPGISRVLAADLPRDPVFGRQLLATGAPCLTDDPPATFRRSPHFADHFAPAGIATGLSMALRTRSGRTTGLVHLATDRAGNFGEWHRALLAALAPVLARAVTPAPVPAVLVPPDCSVSRFRDGRPVPVEGRAPAPGATDPVVVEFVERFARTDAPYLRFLRRDAGRWWEVRLVREPGPPPAVLVAERRAAPLLTARELEILTAVVTGASNPQIAHDFVISPRTVATHIENLLDKLAVTTRTAAAAAALRGGLLLPSPDPASARSVDRVLGVDQHPLRLQPSASGR